MNTVSSEGIVKINTMSELVLRRRGDSAVEFYNAANRLYTLRFIEVAEIDGQRVLYFMLRLADGKRGGAPDKEVGRMIVAVICQYLEEHPDELVVFAIPTTIRVTRLTESSIYGRTPIGILLMAR